MLSSSEIQRITLSGKKVVRPTGTVELEDWDEDDDHKSYDLEPTLETEEGNENTTIEATTPISAATSDLAVNRNGKKLGGFGRLSRFFAKNYCFCDRQRYKLNLLGGF